MAVWEPGNHPVAAEIGPPPDRFGTSVYRIGPGTARIGSDCPRFSTRFSRMRRR
jgi:hypothetical protein